MAQQLELRYPTTSSLYCLRNSLGVWSKGNDDFTVSHARHITFPRVFPIRAMGCLILSLHYILLLRCALQ